MRYVFPMETIQEHLSLREILEFSKRGQFDIDDPYFHYDRKTKFLESVTEDDLERNWSEDVEEDFLLIWGKELPVTPKTYYVKVTRVVEKTLILSTYNENDAGWKAIQYAKNCPLSEWKPADAHVSADVRLAPDEESDE